MKLVILDQRDPPSGAISLSETLVSSEGSRGVDFAGWLDLVGRLYEVLASNRREPARGLD